MHYWIYYRLRLRQEAGSLLFYILLSRHILQVLNNSDVTMKHVPCIEGLRAVDILDFLVRKLKVTLNLPSKLDKKIPNREWMANIGRYYVDYCISANSLDHDRFTNFIDLQLSKISDSISQKKHLSVDIPLALFDAIQSYKMISSTAHFIS